MFIPVLLAALCGLRRGEIVALKWRHVDLANAALAICESIEQTKAGIRRKETKGGRARNLVLPALVLPDLRRHRARQADELLKIGVGLDDELPVVAKEDGGVLQPNSLTHEPPPVEVSAAHPVPRFAPRPRDAHARQRRSSENRSGAPRSLHDSHHIEPLLSRHAGHAKGRRGAG